ncbi:hypothetical protein [Pelagicoccus albus]|uniref:Type II secretion system protein GspE N-terminal domain-containing protein n=1 Tax=Pelagicoccus albus TaxID=415222 RepID=A0A7X1E9E8_9BACT|nr:hypothetical protein [Pelagicoccus albus]MBC2607775.1 hypothetical protein [Pelagicoccus albus]
MRANRLLGASLVERGLVSIEALDAANERFLELLSNSTGEMRISLLSILTGEIQSLQETKLIEYLVEEEGLGIIDVRNMEIPEEVSTITNYDECWATWTVPFDLVEDTSYIATAYYMSPAVRAFWEQKISGHIVWFAAPQETISGYLETREAEEAKAAMIAS